MLFKVLFICQMHYNCCKRAKRPPCSVVMECYFHPHILDFKHDKGHYKFPTTSVFWRRCHVTNQHRATFLEREKTRTLLEYKMRE